VSGVSEEASASITWSVGFQKTVFVTRTVIPSLQHPLPPPPPPSEGLGALPNLTRLPPCSSIPRHSAENNSEIPTNLPLLDPDVFLHICFSILRTPLPHTLLLFTDLLKRNLRPICIYHTKLPIRRIPLFAPHLARCRNREVATQQIVHQTRDNEAREEIDAVDVDGADGHGFADGVHEADNVDQDAADVGCVAAPGPTKPVKVGGAGLRRVQIAQRQVSPANKVIVADYDTGDAGQEDGIGGEVGGEVVGGLEQVPGTHGQADCGADVPASADVQVSGKQGCHVRPGRNGIRSNISSKLC